MVGRASPNQVLTHAARPPEVPEKAPYLAVLQPRAVPVLWSPLIFPARAKRAKEKGQGTITWTHCARSVRKGSGQSKVELK